MRAAFLIRCRGTFSTVGSSIWPLSTYRKILARSFYYVWPEARWDSSSNERKDDLPVNDDLFGDRRGFQPEYTDWTAPISNAAEVTSPQLRIVVLRLRQIAD